VFYFILFYFILFYMFFFGSDALGRLLGKKVHTVEHQFGANDAAIQEDDHSEDKLAERYAHAFIAIAVGQGDAAHTGGGVPNQVGHGGRSHHALQRRRDPR
jgi:hypothetical protein